MVKTINVYMCTNPCIKVLNYGTIVYMKGHDNIVRECRVVGWVMDEKSIKYTYHIAGYCEYICGSLTQTEIGAIYPTMEIAKYAPSKYSNSCVKDKAWDKVLFEFYPMQMLVLKYSFNNDSFYAHGTWNDFIDVRAIEVRPDNTMHYVNVDMEIYMDKDGIHIDVPMVDNGKLFANMEKAKKSINPKVITFNDSIKTNTREELAMLGVTDSTKQSIIMSRCGILGLYKTCKEYLEESKNNNFIIITKRGLPYGGETDPNIYSEFESLMIDFCPEDGDIIISEYQYWTDNYPKPQEV